jgi:hypothetical protein
VGPYDKTLCPITFTLLLSIFQVKDTRLRFRYNLGDGEQNLALTYVNISDGYWHTAKVKRVGQWVTLTVDKGEGRQVNFTLGQPGGHVEIKVNRRSLFVGGDVR